MGIEVLKGKKYYKGLILQQCKGIGTLLTIKSKIGLSKGIRALLTIKSKMGLNKGIRALLTIKSEIGLGGGMVQVAIKKAGIIIFG